MGKEKVTIQQICSAISNNGGSKSGAARELGVNLRSMKRRIKRHEEKLKGGGNVIGTSILTDGKGNEILTWTKTKHDDSIERLKDAVAALSEEIRPIPEIGSPDALGADLLNHYTITDLHLGMYAWDEEAGEDWDTDIAEKLILAWIGRAIAISPDADTGLLAVLGDFLHWDGIEAVTPEHRHILDADTRFQKLVRCALKVINSVISALLKKHNNVHIKFLSGNHDIAAGAWIREFLVVLYRQNPRVTIDTSPGLYNAFEWGKTSLFFHHGHKRSGVNIADVFIAKFRDLYGRTEYSYAHTGHKHANKVNETSTMLIEQHPTLAAADAYAANGGWVSKRNAKVITYHKDYGKVGELIISPEMVR